MTLPPVPEPFYWTPSPSGVVLRCRALDAVAPHVFTTRELELSSGDDWSRVAEAVGAERVATLEQVHGRDVVVVLRDTALPGNRPRADACISNDPLTAVAVRTADCVPLLLADTGTGAVAAVHAGWRGTAAGVATAAVDALRRRFGVQPRNLVVSIGPSIGVCCYRVGQDVRDAFAAAAFARSGRCAPRHASAAKRSASRTALAPKAGHAALDRWFAGAQLDLVAANRDQLVLAGVPEARIHVCGLCTAMHLDVLTSYRAEKEKAGRLAAAIRCQV